MPYDNFETNAIRAQINRSEFLEHSAPIYLSSSFIFEDAEDMRASFTEEKQRNIYSWALGNLLQVRLFPSISVMCWRNRYLI